TSDAFDVRKVENADDAKSCTMASPLKFQWLAWRFLERTSIDRAIRAASSGQIPAMILFITARFFHLARRSFFHLGLGEQTCLFFHLGRCCAAEGFHHGFTALPPRRTGCSLVLSQPPQRELRPLRTSSGLSAAVD